MAFQYDRASLINWSGIIEIRDAKLLEGIFALWNVLLAFR